MLRIRHIYRNLNTPIKKPHPADTNATRFHNLAKRQHKPPPFGQNDQATPDGRNRTCYLRVLMVRRCLPIQPHQTIDTLPTSPTRFPRLSTKNARNTGKSGKSGVGDNPHPRLAQTPGGSGKKRASSSIPQASVSCIPLSLSHADRSSPWPSYPYERANSVQSGPKQRDHHALGHTRTDPHSPRPAAEQVDILTRRRTRPRFEPAIVAPTQSSTTFLRTFDGHSDILTRQCENAGKEGRSRVRRRFIVVRVFERGEIDGSSNRLVCRSLGISLSTNLTGSSVSRPFPSYSAGSSAPGPRGFSIPLAPDRNQMLNYADASRHYLNSKNRCENPSD